MSIEESVMREAKTSGGIGHELYAIKMPLDIGFSLYYKENWPSIIFTTFTGVLYEL